MPQRVDVQLVRFEVTKDAVLTKKEIANFFNVSVRTVERWVARRQIPFLVLPHQGSRREIRFRHSAIFRWMEKRTVVPSRHLSSPVPGSEKGEEK